jgi:hypothetical protein
MLTIKEIKYNYDKLDIFRRPIKETTRRDISDGEGWALWGIAFGFIVTFAIALFTI